MSQGQCLGRSSPKQRHRPPGTVAKIAGTSCEPITLCCFSLVAFWVTNATPSSFYREAELQEPTPSSPSSTANYSLLLSFIGVLAWEKFSSFTGAQLLHAVECLVCTACSYCVFPYSRPLACFQCIAWKARCIQPGRSLVFLSHQLH